MSALVVIAAAALARSTARDIAELQGRQKRRDADVVFLDHYGDALVNAASTVQFYVWWEGDFVDKFYVDEDEWTAKRDVLSPVVRSLQILRYRAMAIPSSPQWTEVSEAHDGAMDVFERVAISDEHSEKPVGRAAWNDAIGDSPQPDPIMRAVSSVANLRRELLNTYPETPPDSIAARLRSVFRVNAPADATSSVDHH